MSAPGLAAQVALAGDYPALNFNQRERKLLESVKVYVDALSPDTVITTQGDIIVGNVSGNAARLAKGASGTVPVAGASTIAYALLLNANIDPSAAIAYSKLNLAASLVNADVAVGAAIAYSKLNLSGSLLNADVNASAGIVYSKLSLTGGIVNADVNASAAVAYSKLNLSNSIIAGDLTSSSVTLAKLHSGVAPSHVVKYAGKPTTVGGSPSEVFSVPGAIAASDLVTVTLNNDGTANVTILTANISSDGNLTVVFSADPGNDAVFTYQILRAAA